MSNFKVLSVLTNGQSLRRLVNFDLVTEILPPCGGIEHSTIRFNTFTVDGVQDAIYCTESFSVLIEMSRETTVSNMLKNISHILEDSNNKLRWLEYLDPLDSSLRTVSHRANDINLHQEKIADQLELLIETIENKVNT